MTLTETRPAARKVTAKNRTQAARAAQQADDSGIRIKVGDEAYELRHGDLSALDTRELRKQVGVSFQGLLRELGSEPDIDSIAALVWLARRVNNGERSLTYDEVALELDYDAELDLEDIDGVAEEVDPSDPEA